MNKIEKRIEWIDICKAVGILFVIVGHVGIPESVDIWIHAFHMPLFFMLSGLCYKEKKHQHFLPFIKSRFLSLIVPYILFSVILYFLWNIIMYYVNINNVGTCGNLVNCMFTPASTTSCFGAVNWFLPSLFIVEVFFWIICKITKYSKTKCTIAIIFLSLISYCYPIITQYRIPLAIDSSLMGTTFYGIGWLMKNINYSKIKITLKRSILFSYTILAFLFGFFLRLSFVNRMTNVRTLLYGDYSLYFVNAIGITCLFMILSILLDIASEKIKTLNLLKFAGKNTMIILLLNGILARFYNILMEIYNSSIHNKILILVNSVFVSIIIMILCVLLSIVVNKYLPFLLGKKRKQ